MCQLQQHAWPFRNTFLGMQPTFLLLGNLVRNLAISEVSAKPSANLGILEILRRNICSQPHLWFRNLWESLYIHLQNPKTNRDKGTLWSLYLLLMELAKIEERCLHACNNNSKGVRNHKWGSNTTSTNKARSYKQTSTIEEGCWITLEHPGSIQTLASSAFVLKTFLFQTVTFFTPRATMDYKHILTKVKIVSYGRIWVGPVI